MTSVVTELKSEAGSEAVNCVELTKVVVRGEPLTLMVVAGTKFEPLTVKLIAPLPTMTAPGANELMTGAGA